jgi:hypothetical protein
MTVFTTWPIPGGFGIHRFIRPFSGQCWHQKNAALILYE